MSRIFETLSSKSSRNVKMLQALTVSPVQVTGKKTTHLFSLQTAQVTGVLEKTLLYTLGGKYSVKLQGDDRAGSYKRKMKC